MARFTRTHTSQDGSEVWTHGRLTIRLWPTTTGYKAQDGLLYTWAMTNEAHDAAVREGLEHTTIADVVARP